MLSRISQLVPRAFAGWKGVWVKGRNMWIICISWVMIRNVPNSGHQMSKIVRSERIFALSMHCLHSDDAKKQSTAGKIACERRPISGCRLSPPLVSAETVFQFWTFLCHATLRSQRERPSLSDSVALRDREREPELDQDDWYTTNHSLSTNSAHHKPIKKTWNLTMLDSRHRDRLVFPFLSPTPIT